MSNSFIVHLAPPPQLHMFVPHYINLRASVTAVGMSFVSFHRSLLFMGALTVIGTGVGVYIMIMAVLSPCPVLVNDTSGGVIIVSALVHVCYSNNSQCFLLGDKLHFFTL